MALARLKSRIFNLILDLFLYFHIHTVKIRAFLPIIIVKLNIEVIVLDIANVGFKTTAVKVDNTIKTSSEASKNNINVDKGNGSTDIKDLKSAVDFSNKVLFKNNTHLKFQVHKVTKDIMVKIIDDETGDVLKEIPPEKILDMVAKLWEIAGIFVDERR